MALKRRTVLALAAAYAVLALPMAGVGRIARAQGTQDPRPPELAGRWPGARLRGQGRLRFFGLSVYDIRLWTPADAPATLADRWAQTPLALEIQYARRLVGKLIAERSIDEMRRQADVPPAKAEVWQAEMARLFPDVQDGDRLTGVLLPGEAARFYYNGSLRGELRDPEFARLFFGIWLAPQTSEPALRERLLGQGT